MCYLLDLVYLNLERWLSRLNRLEQPSQTTQLTLAIEPWFTKNTMNALLVQEDVIN